VDLLEHPEHPEQAASQDLLELQVHPAQVEHPAHLVLQELLEYPVLLELQVLQDIPVPLVLMVLV
jgi:hypothetical protein